MNIRAHYSRGLRACSRLHPGFVSSDCHSPDFTPAYDRPSTDQASSAILSLYSCALAIASSMAYHDTGINLQDVRRSENDFSEPWINMQVHRLSSSF